MADPADPASAAEMLPPPGSRPAAQALFGDRLPLAQRYAQLLVTVGAERGLIGPRERDRVWDRHVLNSAVLAELLDHGESVADVGSGAGLPGIPLSLARPDLCLILVEPMQRRCVFLREVVAELELEARVSVVRGRAPECAREIFSIDCVTARAVAPLDRLVSWTMPLCRPGGRLLALRGRTAEHEVAQAEAEISQAGGEAPRVRVLGSELLAEPVTVAEVRCSATRKSRRGGARNAEGHKRT